MFIVLGFTAVPLGIVVSLACGLESWAAALVAGGAALPLLLIGFRLSEKIPDPPHAPPSATPPEPEPPERTSLRELGIVAVCALVAGLGTYAAGAPGVWVVLAVATCVSGWVLLLDGASHVVPKFLLALLGGEAREPDRGIVRFVYGFIWAVLACAAVYSSLRGDR